MSCHKCSNAFILFSIFYVKCGTYICRMKKKNYWGTLSRSTARHFVNYYCYSNRKDDRKCDVFNRYHKLFWQLLYHYHQICNIHTYTHRHTISISFFPFINCLVLYAYFPTYLLLIQAKFLPLNLGGLKYFCMKSYLVLSYNNISQKIR